MNQTEPVTIRQQPGKNLTAVADAIELCPGLEIVGPLRIDIPEGQRVYVARPIGTAATNTT